MSDNARAKLAQRKLAKLKADTDEAIKNSSVEKCSKTDNADTMSSGKVDPDNIAAPGPVNFMASSDRFFLNVSKRPNVDPVGFFDVVAHGSPNKIQIETPNGPVLVDHRTAARLIGRQPGYNGQNIRLFSCSTGACATGFAQNLSNKLNVEIQAPTDLLWAYPGGKTLVAPKAINGQPDLNNLGKIKIFLPKKHP